MKKLIFNTLFLSLSVLIVSSCKDECEDVICQNNGSCNEGVCICPEGYTGDFCESFDHSKVQLLLDNGVHPFELLDGGIPYDSLYGKTYLDGYIFLIDPSSNYGFVVEKENEENWIPWGCQGLDIENASNVTSSPPQDGEGETEPGARIGEGQANTMAILEDCSENGIAARICSEIGPEWFLPSRGELNAMYQNLHLKGKGGFVNNFHWSSTERNSVSANALNFSNGSNFSDIKNSSMQVRAVRAF